MPKPNKTWLNGTKGEWIFAVCFAIVFITFAAILEGISKAGMALFILACAAALVFFGLLDEQIGRDE